MGDTMIVQTGAGTREMPDSYFAICEELQDSWIRDTPRSDWLESLPRPLDISYFPEPYLVFPLQACAVEDSQLRNPLYILTTNPGGGMTHQQRTQVLAGTGPISAATSYRRNAYSLGRYYQNCGLAHSAGGGKIAHAGRGRIEKMLDLVAKIPVQFDSVIQVEAVPYHSQTLPKSPGWLDSYIAHPAIRRYHNALRLLLSSKSVICVQAIRAGALSPLGIQAPSPWFELLADLMGFSFSNQQVGPTIGPTARPTGAFILDGESAALKAFWVMVGSNNLPAVATMSRIGCFLKGRNGSI
jgi:hypothetical protein